MILQLIRYNSDKDHTNGVLLINGRFECYVLEDEYREQKKHGETRIPDGKYRIKFRKEGGFHQRYLRKYGATWHKGMLELQDVPNFKWILFHAGNHDDNTDGCLLVGQSQSRGENWIGSSIAAYKAMYPKVRNALLSGNEVWIEITTVDVPV